MIYVVAVLALGGGLLWFRRERKRYLAHLKQRAADNRVAQVMSYYKTCGCERCVARRKGA